MSNARNQPLASLTRDERHLLIYAGVYRVLIAISILTVTTSLALLLVALFLKADGANVQRASNSLWVYTSLGAAFWLLAIWYAFGVICSASGLPALGTHLFPLPIPTRRTLIFQITGPFFYIPLALRILGESSSWPTPEGFWLPAIEITFIVFLVSVFGSIAPAWRARTLLDRVQFLPDVSLVEEEFRLDRVLAKLLNRLGQAQRHDRQRPASPAT